MARPGQRLAQSPVRAGVQSSAAVGRSVRSGGGGGGVLTDRLFMEIDGVLYEQVIDSRGLEVLVKVEKEN